MGDSVKADFFVRAIAQDSSLKLKPSKKAPKSNLYQGRKIKEGEVGNPALFFSVFSRAFKG